MPTYGMPGVESNRGKSLRTGVVAAAVVAVVVAGWFIYSSTRTDDGLEIALQTEQLGDGITDTTEVRLDGVQVGKVTDIEPVGEGLQRITMRLNKSQLFGIDDSLAVDYAPANLFGISEIELKRGKGGSPLVDDMVIDLTGPRGGDVYDATMGSLLRSLASVSNDVLTPKLSSVLQKLATNVKAFTPLLQAIVTGARTLSEQQRYELSFLFGEYGSAMSGVAPFVSSTVDVLDRVNNIDVLRNDRAHFDATIAAVINDIFPALSGMLFSAQDALSSYADMFTPLLGALSQTVSTPQQSGAQLRELLLRLGSAMQDTPDGPVLNLAIDLRGVPGLAVPLLAGLPVTYPQEGPR